MKLTEEGFKRVLEHTEQHFAWTMRNQITNTGDWKHGGIMSIGEGMVPYNSAGLLHTAGFLYFLEDSIYYKSKEVYTFAVKALDFYERNMSEEGLMHFYMCNYKSAPDTSFTLIPLCEIYRFIQDKETDEDGEYLKFRILKLIKTLADGVIAGGFHTPNHRWVISAALSMVVNITKDQKYMTRINEFLSEGIDCDEDGEYTERSPGSYNRVNNEALLIMSKELNMPHLLEFVARNLKMMTYYIDWDFRLFTNNSTRQDKGENDRFLDMYYYQYLKTGYLLQDKELLSIAKAIEDNNYRNGNKILLGLNTLINEKELLGITDDVEPFKLKPFTKHFKKSGLVRIYHKDMTLTILGDSPTFLYLRYKGLDMYIRGGINFFNERHIKVNNIQPIEDGFTMEYEGRGRYLLPLKEPQDLRDYRKFDMALRDTTPEQIVNMTIEIKKTDKGFEITTKSRGEKQVPVRYDIALNTGVLVRGDGYALRANGGGILFPEKGYVKLDTGTCGLKIGPCVSETYINQGLWGTIPLSQDDYHIFLSSITPFEQTFNLEPYDRYED